GDLSPGTNTTLAIEGMPAFTNGLLVFDLFPNPIPWNGGQLISPAPVILGTTFADVSGNFIVPLAIGGLLPPGFTVTAFRIFPVTVEGGGSVQLAKAYAVGDGFARQTGLTTDMPAGFETDGLMQDSCLVGSGLAESLGGGPTVWVEGKACRVAGHFDAPVRPPFAELSRSLLIADREDSFEQV
ncbi:MAG: hypothetical protein ABGW90_11665, partial [Martelella sp.]